ncbi:hypothetical protein GQ53DRAFT_216025 [Thozetella sp. PMI_491]|nr:hypothetical protein GQ53DRAFT_216025 [Thozetella sp. PMI_491]
MAAQQVNGDVAHSAFLDHLLGYPLINDGVSTFKSNPYGQKSLQLGDSAYQTFAKPVLPYFSKPYTYLSPYVKKADDLGDKTLANFDARFPVVKKPTGELYADAKGLVLYPLHVGQAGRDHVLSTFSAERKKIGDETLITYGKAAVTTALILTTETIQTVSTYLSAKKEEAKTVVDEKANGI